MSEEIRKEVQAYAAILEKRWGVDANVLTTQGMLDAQAGDPLPDVLRTMARKAMRKANEQTPIRRHRS